MRNKAIPIRKEYDIHEFWTLPLSNLNVLQHKENEKKIN